MLNRTELAGLGALYELPQGQIDLPMTQRTFFGPAMVAENLALIERIRATYGQTVTRMATLTNLPEEIVYSFIFIESRGVANARNKAALGLMQVDQGTAAVAVFYANKEGRLTGEILTELTRLLGGTKVRALLKMTNQTPTPGSLPTAAQLFNPEFNVLAGCLLIAHLMARHTTPDGLIRMDKVIVNYNAGVNKKVSGPDWATPDKVIKNLNAITAGYILKMVGPNGILTTLVA